MKTRRQYDTILIGISFYILIHPQNAYAYLDPGSGSLFFQALIGVILGAVVTAKIWVGRLKVFLLGLFSGKNKDTK